MNHSTFKAKLMIHLQKKYLDKIRIYTATTGLAYFKRGNRFVGPFKMGQKGFPDTYGYIKGNPAVPFWFEIKVGRDKLSAEQIKNKKVAEDMGILFKEIRSFEDAEKVIDSVI